MEETVKDWFTIIETMNNSNTYKLAWGRAILELCYHDSYDENDHDVTITFADISQKMLKYYWNQTYYFNLKQGPLNQEPEVMRTVKEVIRRYQELTTSLNPVWFNKAEELLKKEEAFFQKIIKQMVRILKQDVSWRFLKSHGKDTNIYRVNKEAAVIIMSKSDVIVLKSYAPLLIQLMNYKWVQLLEKYNRSPKIAHKVKGSLEEQIRRNNLQKYKNILIKQFNNQPIIDFYTGKVLDDHDISVDHVIPWSFMYSDDLWNLVITSKSTNSRKSNLLIREEYIEKLINEKEELLRILPEKNRYFFELKEALSNNYIKKYYYDFKL